MELIMALPESMTSAVLEKAVSESYTEESAEVFIELKVPLPNRIKLN